MDVVSKRYRVDSFSSSAEIQLKRCKLVSVQDQNFGSKKGIGIHNFGRVDDIFFLSFYCFLLLKNQRKLFIFLRNGYGSSRNFIYQGFDFFQKIKKFKSLIQLLYFIFFPLTSFAVGKIKQKFCMIIHVFRKREQSRLLSPNRRFTISV